jgi:hypothetical protein
VLNPNKQKKTIQELVLPYYHSFKFRTAQRRHVEVAPLQVEVKFLRAYRSTSSKIDFLKNACSVNFCEGYRNSEIFLWFYGQNQTLIKLTSVIRSAAVEGWSEEKLLFLSENVRRILIFEGNLILKHFLVLSS